MSRDWVRVTTTERPVISAGWKGSMPSFTPRSAAYDASRSMPSSTAARAASRSRSGAGPQTRTSTSVPRVAASSTARRLSSRRDRRSAAVLAGNIPPRHRLDTRNPASRTMRALSSSPVSAILSRHSPIQGRPARTQPSAASRTLQLLVVFWLRLRRPRSGGGIVGVTSSYTGDGQHPAHAPGGALPVQQQPRPVGEDEQFGEVHYGAGAFEPPDHAEVVLVAVQVREEDHTRLVVLGGRLEYVAAERHRGGQYFFVAVGVTGVEGRERAGGGGRYGVEDAEEGVGEAFFVPSNELGVVEVVAGVHLDAPREASAHLHLPVLVQQGYLYAVHLLGVVEVAVAPVTFEGRVEHAPEPVEYHGARDLRQYAAVDLRVLLRLLGNGGEGAARHEDHAPSLALHEPALLLVGGRHVLQGRARGPHVVGAGAAGYLRAVAAGLCHGAADELLRGLPVEPHPALGRVHGLGEREAERPQVAPVGHGGFPVECRARRRVNVGQRVGDHVGGRVRDPALGPPRRLVQRDVPARRVRGQRAVCLRQQNLFGHLVSPLLEISVKRLLPLPARERAAEPLSSSGLRRAPGPGSALLSALQAFHQPLCGAVAERPQP